MSRYYLSLGINEPEGYVLENKDREERDGKVFLINFFDFCEESGYYADKKDYIEITEKEYKDVVNIMGYEQEGNLSSDVYKVYIEHLYSKKV